MTRELELLLTDITNHPALNNDFYREWMTRRFTIDELAIFARNYGAWVKSFPDALAILLVTTDDIAAKTEYVKTLYSEMGYGNSEKVHSALLSNFFTELAHQMGHDAGRNWDNLQKTAELLPTMQAPMFLVQIRPVAAKAMLPQQIEFLVERQRNVLRHIFNSLVSRRASNSTNPISTSSRSRCLMAPFRMRW